MRSEAMRSLNVPRYIRMAATALMAMSGPWDAGNVAADELNQDYAALERAVLDGKDVHMVIDLSACLVHGTDKSGPSVRGSRRFDGYMIQGDGTIAFSATHFTVRADKTPVSEFLSYRVRATGKISAHTIFLNPTTYAILQEAEFDCEIGKGATFHW
jgi:hypothetical protein